MVLTPNENKTAIPPLVCSYFDPLKESYVTVKSEELPVVVEGGTAPAPTRRDRERLCHAAPASAAQSGAGGRRHSLSADRSTATGSRVSRRFSAAGILGGAGRSVPGLDWFFRLEIAAAPPGES